MFSAEVSKKLVYYVYRLIDPRNGETFYIGKGKGNRVFAHAAAAVADMDRGVDEDDESDKIVRIRRIIQAGLKVIMVIHRHGLTENEAYEVEAALIDATPGLTNIQGGHGSDDYGPMSTEEIIARYEAQPANFEDKVLIIKIHQQTVDDCNGSIYEAVRRCWKISRNKAEQVEYVVAAINGLIVGVYIPEQWVNTSNTDRLEFTGSEAPAAIQNKYVHKCLPPEYSKWRTANPIQYTW